METSLWEKPVLLLLHGIRTQGHGEKWQALLNEALTTVGYPDLSGVTVVAPEYSDELDGRGDCVALPPRVISPLPKDRAKEHRRNFEQRTASIERLLGEHVDSKRFSGADVVRDLALEIEVFSQAANYLNTDDVRARVLTKVLGMLPDSGRVVIVGHSLGSVVAADLLLRLPEKLTVAGMVTFGSPLSSRKFDIEEVRKNLTEPAANLQWWVNFWSRHDIVALFRGLSSVFPWLVDIPIQTPRNPGSAHSAASYLKTDAVAKAIGYGLFGSQTKELALASSNLDIALDYEQRVALEGLRYAHLVGAELEKDVRERYFGALRQVQSQTVEGLRLKAIGEDRALPAEIARLHCDVMGNGDSIPVPGPVRVYDREETITRLIYLAESNPITPFDVEIKDRARQAALKRYTKELELGHNLDHDVSASLDEAEKALSVGGARKWMKWGAVGIGLAAVAAATGGLALAPAAGLYGAAAMTSALAAFGPGGMIGGLLTAGTLLSAGAGTMAVGVMSPATSAANVEAMVKTQLAVSILAKKRGLDNDPTIWTQFVETERQLNRAKEQLDEFSDPKSPRVEELKQKLNSVQAALAYMEEHGLSPSEATVISDEADDGEGGEGKEWVIRIPRPVIPKRHR